MALAPSSPSAPAVSVFSSAGGAGLRGCRRLFGPVLAARLFRLTGRSRDPGPRDRSSVLGGRGLVLAGVRGPARAFRAPGILGGRCVCPRVRIPGPAPLGGERTFGHRGLGGARRGTCVFGGTRAAIASGLARVPAARGLIRTRDGSLSRWRGRGSAGGLFVRRSSVRCVLGPPAVRLGRLGFAGRGTTDERVPAFSGARGGRLRAGFPAGRGFSLRRRRSGCGGFLPRPRRLRRFGTAGRRPGPPRFTVAGLDRGVRGGGSGSHGSRARRCGPGGTGSLVLASAGGLVLAGAGGLVLAGAGGLVLAGAGGLAAGPIPDAATRG